MKLRKTISSKTCYIFKECCDSYMHLTLYLSINELLLNDIYSRMILIKEGKAESMLAIMP